MLATLVLFAVLQQAQPVEDARRAYDAMEFDRCVKTLTRAARSLMPARERAEVELLLGLCLFNRGKVKQAEAGFRLALQLDPSLELPALISPKIASTFQRIRDELQPPPGPTAPEPPDPAPALPAPAPARPAALEADDATPEPAPAPPVVEDAPLQPVALVPAVVAPEPELVRPAFAAPRTSRTVAVTLGVTAIVASAIGVALGASSASAHADAGRARFQAEILDANERAQGLAIGANIAWGVAGATAVGGLVALLVDVSQ